VFIVLEGIDGCGKTTQAERLAGWAARRQPAGEVLLTREPGGWDGSGAIRGILLGGSLTSVWSEFFLFMADRCEHVSRVIKPALARGCTVICDRYTPSTLAYQILSAPDVPGDVAQCAVGLSESIGLPEPDVIFLLDIDADTARRRFSSRGERDAFEGRGEKYFERVREGYNMLMRNSARGWKRIDASRDEDAVFADLTRYIEGMP
jgi:dTMP kinase